MPLICIKLPLVIIHLLETDVLDLRNILARMHCMHYMME
jgi:hypothetical protein